MPDEYTYEAPREAAAINRLFDLVLHRRRKHNPNFGEYAFFREVLGESNETDAAFSRFLHDVSSCPPCIVTAAQSLLADVTK